MSPKVFGKSPGHYHQIEFFELTKGPNQNDGIPVLEVCSYMNRLNLLWAFLSSKTGNLTPPNGSLYSLMEEDESTTLCHDNEDLDLLDFFFNNEEGASKTSTENSHSLSHCDLLLHLAGAHIWDSIQTECRL